MQLAYLALGSNRGKRRCRLAEAVIALGQLPDTHVRAVSALYESAYVGPGEQEAYLNACVLLETDSSPEELLSNTQELERLAGRKPNGHMMPRTLDIDLLVMGEETRATEHLQLPHPRLGERRFVLQPLSDLDPELVPPGIRVPVREMLRAPAVRSQELRQCASSSWWEEGG